ncbi:MAG TPA: hypothetical protein EYH22_02125 [Candidatus Nanopusillus sp.]|nr:hypothetical protein [Candidatus Nanopusillus sp.]
MGGLFNIFKKKKEKENINQNKDDYQQESNEEPTEKYKKEHKEKETLIINSLKPYKCSQKVIIWNDGKKEIIYGYPVALIPTEKDYIILYRIRATDYFDELIIRLKSIFLGYKEQYRILRVPEYCLLKSSEILTIYAHSFRVINPLTEEAIPIENNDPRRRIFWEVERQKADAYRNALYKVIHDEFPTMIERALALNPTMRAYQGRENMKGKKETKVKEFSGVEMGFSIFDELENQLKKEAGIDE